MQSLQPVQAPVSRNESLDLVPVEAAGSFPLFSLESAYLWGLYLASQFALFSIFLNRPHHQKLYCFFFACDMVRKEARNLRKKKIYKQPRKRKDKTNPPTEAEISELIYFNFQLALRFSNLLTLKSTLNLGWSTSSKTLIIFFLSRIYIHSCTGDR